MREGPEVFFPEGGRGQHRVQIMPENLLPCVTEYLFGRFIPKRDVAGFVEHDNRIRGGAGYDT